MKMKDSIKRSVTHVEAAYEVPPGCAGDVVEAEVLGPFGSTIDGSWVDTVDGKDWLITGGEPAMIDQVDAAYLTWRSKLEQ